MHYYCTYVDTNYLVRFLALSSSLNIHDKEHRIFALCLDDQSALILKALNKNSVSIIHLSELEKFDAELYATRLSRNLVDYYQTATPCYMRFVFEIHPSVNQVTFLDPDIYLFSSPQPIFKEIGECSIAIIENNFSINRNIKEATANYYVSWLTVRRSKIGFKALAWYRDKCIDWCFDRVEAKKYGDQGYLKEIVSKFPGVVKLNKPEMMLGVWNIGDFSLGNLEQIITVDSSPLISFHFQGVWEDGSGGFDCVLPSENEKSDSILSKEIYEPYCKCIFSIMKTIQESWPEINLKPEHRYDIPANPQQWSVKTIGDVPWKPEAQLDSLEEFLEVYSERPIKSNQGGVLAPHAFGLWFMAKELAPDVIIESGIWKGMTTWLLEKACPNAQIYSIDLHLKFREYISKKVKYFEEDFSEIDWRNILSPKSLAFFDDHQNAYDRIHQCQKLGIKDIIFEDNYPPLRGDCYSLKKVFAGSGLTDPDTGVFLIRNLHNTEHTRPTKEDKILPNQIDASKMLDNLNIYYEFPPVFKRKTTRWGDPWSDSLYPTPKALLEEPVEKLYKLFWEEAQNYTWMCYARLK